MRTTVRIWRYRVRRLSAVPLGVPTRGKVGTRVWHSGRAGISHVLAHEKETAVPHRRTATGRDAAAGRDSVERRRSTPIHLPGIGERIELADADAAEVAVVRRHDGRVEIERRADGLRIEFDEPTARTLGAFVTGHYLLPVDVAEQLDEVRGGLVFDWHRLSARAAAVGRSIRELAIRQRTGVSIVAVIRREGAIIDPDPIVVLGAGDVLVTASRASVRDAFVRLVEGGPDGA